MRRNSISYTPVFEKNLKAYQSGRYGFIANEGSSRSSKTVSLMQLVVWIAANESNQVISICSPSLPHLKMGARRDFINVIGQAGLYQEENFKRTDNIYTFPSTGTIVEFFGVDNEQKVRGPGRDYLFINEANLLKPETYKQLAIRTRKTKLVDYNPEDSESFIYPLADDPANIKIHSTYKNNLSNLTPEIIREIESLQYADRNMWRVYGLGLRGSSEDKIYTHWKLCDKLPGVSAPFFGQDFGFNVPSALVEIEIYDGAIYVNELLYEARLTTADIVERYKELKISQSEDIFCDSAAAAQIEELKRAGYNARQSSKDVLEGIRKVKSMPLYITKDSVNLIKEIKSYKWRKDMKTGKVLDEPVKYADHLLDALRYGVYTRACSFQFEPWAL